MLYTLAYPRLTADDAEFIRGFRRLHDLPYRDVVGAHFTLLFGCDAIPFGEYSSHVASMALQSVRFSFHCRYAMLGAGETGDDNAYIFLVPDEGYSEVSLLHDRLYSGLMAPFLRLDLPFTPHINIGTLADRARSKALCDELNGSGVSVEGSVDSVTIGELKDGRLVDRATFDLSEH